MKNKIIFLLLLLGSYVSLSGVNFSETYDNYKEKLVKKKVIVTDKRTTSEEKKALDSTVSERVKKRDLKDKIKDTESSVRKEIRKIF